MPRAVPHLAGHPVKRAGANAGAGGGGGGGGNVNVTVTVAAPLAMPSACDVTSFIAGTLAQAMRARRRTGVLDRRRPPPGVPVTVQSATPPTFAAFTVPAVDVGNVVAPGVEPPVQVRVT